LLRNDVQQEIQKRRLAKLSKLIIQLHDVGRPHTANLMKVTLAMGWEIKYHPPYSPNLAPSDFSLFGPIKVHLGGHKFQTDYQLKSGVSWTHYCQVETFHTAGISNLTERRENVCENRIS
jgi:histone-lysine N-methyltransferase SETMAR